MSVDRRSVVVSAAVSWVSLLLDSTMANTNIRRHPDKNRSQIPPLLDHLVWLAGDLDAACEQFEAASGVKPIYGGIHPSGTHNALVSLGSKVYLEIAAPVAGAKAGHPWVDAARRRPEPHLYSYCMRSALPLRELAKATAKAGIRALGPSEGSRNTPEGVDLNWQLLIPIVPGGGKAIPFLIDWEDTPHPAETTSSAVKLGSFSVQHPEPNRIRDAMALLAPDVFLSPSQEELSLSAELLTPFGPITLSS